MAKVGARGDFEAITFTRTSGLCAPGAVCETEWTISSDGTAVRREGGVSTPLLLDPAAPREVRAMVDGPDLRLGLSRGFSCDAPPTDVSVRMTLTLSTTALTADVTGCALTGPQGNPVLRVFRWVQNR